MFQTEKRKYFKLRMGIFIIAAMNFQQATGGAMPNVPELKNMFLKDGKLQVRLIWGLSS